MAAIPRETLKILHATAAGLCANLVGIGLARFAYTPLLPALIEWRWFEPSAAAYLGAANLAGYLAGALFGRFMATRTDRTFVLRGMMLLATASFFACAFPLSFLWFFLWRFASGLSGGVLMVLAAPAVLARVPLARRGIAGGAMFAGVGLGIIAAATLVPGLLRVGLMEAWLGLGTLALVLTAAAWSGWPVAPPPPQARPKSIAAAAYPSAALRALYLEYGLNAVALVPHMVFLVDFVARGLGQGVAVGSRYWAIFGIGALAGPVLSGYLADRIGFGRALRLAFVIQAAGIALPVFTDATAALVVSSLVAGAFAPGIVPLVLGRVQELLPNDSEGRAAAWSFCTVAFAVGQAAAAYACSYVFARTEGAYVTLFAMGAGAVLAALAVDLLFGAKPSRLREA